MFSRDDDYPLLKVGCFIIDLVYPHVSSEDNVDLVIIHMDVA